MSLYIEHIVEKGGERIDLYLSKQIPQFSRSLSGAPTTHFYINNKEVKRSRVVATGDLAAVRFVPIEKSSLIAQHIELSILYEDDDILVINKEQSMVVHPGSGIFTDTVANALLYRYQGTSFDTLDQSQLRPGIVHRLDKETSGVMIIALNENSYRELVHQFKERAVVKHYVAIVEGELKIPKKEINLPIIRNPHNRKQFTVAKEGEGKEALTYYTLLKQYDNKALIALNLITGRTHQIRVHMCHIGHPIVGDPLYGRTKKGSLMLHALSLELTHPTTKEVMKFRAPLPDRFKELLLR